MVATRELKRKINETKNAVYVYTTTATISGLIGGVLASSGSTWHSKLGIADEVIFFGTGAFSLYKAAREVTDLNKLRVLIRK